MDKKTVIITILIFLAVCLAACNGSSMQTEIADTSYTTSAQTKPSSVPSLPPDSTVGEETYTETPLPSETTPAHSALYMDNLDVEEVIRYFNEVCLDAEIVNSGNANLLQKWTEPIYYILNGDPTAQDMDVLNNFTAWLNTVEGFPGIYETQDAQNANLRIHFCTQQDMLTLMGENFTGMDGAVTFWYRENMIYDAIICYRTDLDQFLRNSVILEEIYNGLGPIQDTLLRSDSIIYNGYSEPQQLTEIDELILKLLYHPQMQCGMNAHKCETVIRQLYY